MTNFWQVKTPWTTLISLQDGKQQGLERLLNVYSAPLYSYLRAQGLSQEDAEDLSQHVLLDFFIVKESHKRVSRAKGRFRDYLLSAARNAFLDFKKHGRAIRRGGDKKIVSLDQLQGERSRWEPSGEGSPEDQFERQWALATWRAALELLRAEAPLLAEALETFYGARKISQEQAAQALGISLACFNSRASTARRKLLDCLRQIVLPTLEDPSDLPAELERLRCMLRKTGATLGSSENLPGSPSL